MRRVSIPALVLLPVLVCWAGLRGACRQEPAGDAARQARLAALYRVYQAYEVDNGSPATEVDDLALPADVKAELKDWLNLDGLGRSLADARKDDLSAAVMAFEKAAPRDGGLVLFYDGSVRAVSADEFRQLPRAGPPRPPGTARVYVHSGKLTPADKLSFGPADNPAGLIPIHGEATLMFVDLTPDARSLHRTECVLVSAEGTRVIKGSGWLVLNGRDLFRDGKEVRAAFPVDLTGR